MVTSKSHAPSTTVLAQTVATYRTRATLISPWHAVRAQPLTRATARPGTWHMVADPQSRCNLEVRDSYNQDAVEIVSRLRIRYQAAQFIHFSFGDATLPP